MGNKEKSLKLILPFPPLDNHYYTVSGGRKRLSKKSRVYIKEVMYTVRPDYTMTERVIMSITPHHSARYHYDIGNCIKCIGDILEKIKAYENDSQVDKIIICRGVVEKNNGYVDIELTEVDGDKFDPEYLESLKEK